MTVKSFILSAALLSLFSAVQAQTCTQTTTSNNINVNANDVICISGNISNANVSIASGGTLKVLSGGSLSIQNFNNFNGTLINDGTLVVGNINFGNGGVLTNEGQMTINGNMNFNGTATINNTKDNTITINSTFSLGNNSVINNSGTMISISGDVSFNSGTINNKGRFEVLGNNFNPNGTLVNDGFFMVNNFINLNGGTVINNCRFVVGNGFNVSSNTNFLNNGLIWVTNDATGKIQHNSGVWTNGATGKVRGHDFINNASINGTGEFYFTGDTRQQGTFQGSYTDATQYIKFYDASYTAGANQNYPSSFFDFGIQGNNVVRPATMTPGDTSSFYGACADQSFQLVVTSPLPLKLLSFDAAAQNGNVVLNWETSNETNTQSFIVEYSTDGKSFSKIGTVAATNMKDLNVYSFTQFQVNNVFNLYRLKMVDADGKFTYSPMKSVTFTNANALDLNVYPNPFDRQVSIRYYNPGSAANNTIQVTDITGKVLKSMNWSVMQGQNELSLNTDNLAAGFYFLVLKDNNGVTLTNKKVVKK